MEPVTLLFTARDTGAALQIGAIARQALCHSLFDVEIYAAQPACDVLVGMGLEVNTVDAPIVTKSSGDNYQRLLNTAAEILAVSRPHAILTGLSGPGAGIDEAIIASATGIPCYTFQDYWGDVNHLFDKIADCFFTLDARAAELTQQRFDADVYPAGSPKHALYARHDMQQLRSTLRRRYSLENDTIIIGLFGQPIQPQGEYLDIIRRFSSTAARVDKPSTILYRPHPTDSQSDTDQVMEILASMDLSPENTADEDLLAVLCACDFVCSAFSSCNLDNIFLNYFSPVPLGLSIYLFLNNAIASTHRDQTTLDYPPPIDIGVAEIGRSEDELLKLFQGKLSTHDQYWRQIKKATPDPGRAAQRILNKIVSDLR